MQIRVKPEKDGGVKQITNALSILEYGRLFAELDLDPEVGNVRVVRPKVVIHDLNTLNWGGGVDPKLLGVVDKKLGKGVYESELDHLAITGVRRDVIGLRRDIDEGHCCHLPFLTCGSN